MYFLDENGKRVKNCQNCGANFSPGVISILSGANCSFSCPAKKLELEHEEIAVKIVSYYFSKEKVFFNIYYTVNMNIQSNWL